MRKLRQAGIDASRLEEAEKLFAAYSEEALLRKKLVADEQMGLQEFTDWLFQQEKLIDEIFADVPRKRRPKVQARLT